MIVNIGALAIAALVGALLNVIGHLAKWNIKAPVTYVYGVLAMLAGLGAYGALTGDWVPLVAASAAAVASGIAVFGLYYIDGERNQQDLEHQVRDLQRANREWAVRYIELKDANTRLEETVMDLMADEEEEEPGLMGQMVFSWLGPDDEEDASNDTTGTAEAGGESPVRDDP